MKTQSFGFLFFGFILSSNTSFYFEWLKRKSTFEKNGIFEKKNLLFICDVPNMPNYFWQKIFFPDEAYLRYIKLEKNWKSPNIWNSLNPRQHRSTAKTVLAWNQLFLYEFGSLNSNPASVFPHHVEILQYCQFHGCQVRKSVFRVLWKNYKRYRKSNYI